MKIIKKNMNWVMLFSVLTGFFAICTAVSQNYKDKKSDKDRIADKNEIIKLQKENNDTLNQINNLQSEIILSNKKLIGANQRIEDLNIWQLNYQSGGNSFGYVDISRILDKNGENNLIFGFNKVGDYPIYNVTVTYWNLDDFKEYRSDGRATIEDIKKYTSVNIGDVSQDGMSTFGNTFKILKDGIIKINFEIDSKNGSFSQILRISKKGNTISQAYRVNTNTHGKSKSKILKEYINKEFPVDENGKVKWD